MTSELGAPGPAGAPAVVGATLGDVDLAGLGPLTLRVGQRLLAEVLAVRAETDRMILSIAGRRMEAQVPPGIRQGEIVRVVVAEVLPDRVVFRLDGAPHESAPGAARSAGTAGSAAAPGTVSPLNAPGSPGPTAATAAAAAPSPPLDAARALAELDVPDTPEARAAVHALVERRHALTRDSILPLRAALVGLEGDPEVNARAALRVREDGLPLTARAVELARTSLATGSSAPLGVLLGELVSTLRAALGTPARSTQSAPADPADAAGDVDADAPAAPTPAQLGGGRAPARGVLALAVAEPTAGEIERVVTLYTRIPEAALLEGQDPVPAPGSAEPPPARQNARTLVARLLADVDAPGAARTLEVPAESAAAGAPAALPEMDAQATSPSLATPNAPAIVARSTDPDGAPSPARSETGRPAPAAGPQTAPLDPTPQEEPSVRLRQLVTALHDRIELDQLRNAAVIRAEAQAAASAAPNETLAAGQPAPTTQAAQSLLPTNSLALSIPLAIAGQFATLHLAVQRDPEGGGAEWADAPTAVRASFTLRLRHLGEVGADLRLHGSQVRCRLRAPSPEAEQRLSIGLDALKERLQAGGLDVKQLDCVVAAPSEADVAASTGTVSLRHVAVEA